MLFHVLSEITHDYSSRKINERKFPLYISFQYEYIVDRSSWRTDFDGSARRMFTSYNDFKLIYIAKQVYI